MRIGRASMRDQYTLLMGLFPVDAQNLCIDVGVGDFFGRSPIGSTPHEECRNAHSQHWPYGPEVLPWCAEEVNDREQERNPKPDREEALERVLALESFADLVAVCRCMVLHRCFAHDVFRSVNTRLNIL